MFNNFNGMEQLIIVFTCQSFTPKLSKAYTALKKSRDDFEVRCFSSLADVCSYCTVWSLSLSLSFLGFHHAGFFLTIYWFVFGFCLFR
jgi:hypothetical protein